jgi:hypothetical protein
LTFALGSSHANDCCDTARSRSPAIETDSRSPDSRPLDSCISFVFVRLNLLDHRHLFRRAFMLPDSSTCSAAEAFFSSLDPFLKNPDSPDRRDVTLTVSVSLPSISLSIIAGAIVLYLLLA